MADDTTFDVHRLNATGFEKAIRVSKLFATLLANLDQVPLVSPDLKGTGARERSLVVIKLQEAAFFAKRALALDPANVVQVPSPNETAE